MDPGGHVTLIKDANGVLHATGNDTLNGVDSNGKDVSDEVYVYSYEDIFGNEQNIAKNISGTVSKSTDTQAEAVAIAVALNGGGNGNGGSGGGGNATTSPTTVAAGYGYNALLGGPRFDILRRGFGHVPNWMLKNLGLKYPMKPNRVGQLQPYDPETGRWLSPDVNPSLSQIRGISASSVFIQVGAVNGYQGLHQYPSEVERVTSQSSWNGYRISCRLFGRSRHEDRRYI